MEAAAQARANTTPELLARQRRALKPTTGAPAAVATTNAVVVTEASLRTFYEQHNPANTAPDRLRIVLQHYDGRHDKLVRDLSKRYGAAASAALCAVGQQLYSDDKENVPPPSKSPAKAARRRHTITSPYRPRAAPAPLRAPQRRSVETCVPPEVEVPKTVKASSPPLKTPSVRHVPEVSPPKVWPPSINLADRLAQAVKARFFCDAAAAATVETVSVATSPITVPGAATFVPVWNQCSHGATSRRWRGGVQNLISLQVRPAAPPPPRRRRCCRRGRLRRLRRPGPGAARHQARQGGSAAPHRVAGARRAWRLCPSYAEARRLCATCSAAVAEALAH